MSTASKVTLAVTTAVSLGIIWAVHSKQVEDRAKLHAGIERDLERQAKKRVVNQQLLVKQQELTKLYRQASLSPYDQLLLDKQTLADDTVSIFFWTVH